MIIKKLVLLITCMTLFTTCFSQETEFKYYDPGADAVKDVEIAVAKAKQNNQHVLLQIGGNWCKWCRLYDRWSHSAPEIDSLIMANYQVVHVNFSPENKNETLMKRLEFPQRFGFPVIVILDAEGKRIHTQNSAYLEDGEGYNQKTVAEFLKQWSSSALLESNYKK